MVKTIICSALCASLYIIGCQQPAPAKDPRKEAISLKFANAKVNALLDHKLTKEQDSILIHEYVRRSDSITILERWVDSISPLLNSGRYSIGRNSAENPTITAAELEALKKKFHVRKDEFNGVEIYTHRIWGKNGPGNRKTLYCHVFGDGSISLHSLYYATDWIFHTSVSVIVAGQRYDSPTVETYDQNNRTENGGGHIWEDVNYTSATSILPAIANAANGPIKVRYHGSQYYDDITLPARDVQALKESYQISLALQSK